MSSEIGNKGLLRTLAGALGIIDVKQAPSLLDTTDVKVVAGLDIGSSVMEPIHLVLLGPPVIDVETGYTWEIVGDGGGDFTNNGEFYQRRPDRHVIITDWYMQVQYDAAGIAADAGATSDIYFQRQSAQSFSYLTAGNIEQWYFAGTSRYYQVAFPFWQSNKRDAAGNIHPGMSAGQSLFIPAGESYAITISHVPIVPWPANTRLVGWVNGYALPVGCQIPWL